MRTERRHVGLRRRLVMGGLAFMVGAGSLTLAGCTSPRDTLGTTTSPCFKVLAIATEAIRGEGHFAGVRSLTLGSIARALLAANPSVVDVPEAAAHSRTQVCVVGFHGNFRTAVIAKGWPVDVATGTFAVTVIRQRDNALLDTLVMAKPPVSFRRVFPPFR